MHPMIRARFRTAVVALAVGGVLTSAGGCGSTSETGTGAPGSVAPGAALATTSLAAGPPATAGDGNGRANTRQVTPGTGSSTSSTTTITTVTASTPTSAPTPPSTSARPGTAPTGAAFAMSAVAAFRSKLGDRQVLELTIWVGDLSRAEIEVQDPAKPANVDAYEYDDGQVRGPEPVRLSGSDDLEASLFPVAAVQWDALPAMFTDAVSAIGPLEGSTGVTHLIAKKNVPFDSEIVVNVYVDGGTRTGGGYVQFRADGTRKQVYGPS